VKYIGLTPVANPPRFKDIPQGGAFFRWDGLFIRTTVVGDSNAVSLASGKHYVMFDEDIVVPLPEATILVYGVK
jgi:hypothetical protein